jgi:predicted DsbA family dithiol-disulfide isomerase
MKTVEVYADIGCPFTHVGLLRFVEARRERGSDALLVVHAWPLELVNGKPLDPAFIAEEVEEIRPQVGGQLFSGFDPAAFPNSSIPAMALASAAYGSDPAAGEAVSLELRDLLFEQGRDVADPVVLAAVAAEHGLEFDPGAADEHMETVAADHARGRELGVIGSPHFLTRNGGFFCPALEVGRDSDGHLRVHADPEGFDRFLDAALQ